MEENKEVNNKGIEQTWIPILRITKPSPSFKSKSQTTIRNQFPIQLACARPIHRTQDLTLNGTTFDPTRVTRNGIMYTTL